MAETTKGNGQLHSDVGINISVPLDWTVFLVACGCAILTCQKDLICVLG